MSRLNYQKKGKGKLKLISDRYEGSSLYQNQELNQIFLQMKANVCDLNPALIKKCINGTEQDFIMLMNRAKDYLVKFRTLTEDNISQLLEMFRQCVFGYYVLTPLIEAKEVSDIKVLDFNHIVVKANGERYVADIRFFDEQDFKGWFERILPTMFDVQPVPKNIRIHQSELPVSLCEQILQFVTYSGETVLDSFAGSGVVGEASLNIGRSCILIEILKENIEKIKQRFENNLIYQTVMG